MQQQQQQATAVAAAAAAAVAAAAAAAAAAVAAVAAGDPKGVKAAQSDYHDLRHAALWQAASPGCFSFLYRLVSLPRHI